MCRQILEVDRERRRTLDAAERATGVRRCIHGFSARPLNLTLDIQSSLYETQLKPEEWKKGNYREAAVIRRPADKLSQQFGILFYDIEENGLGSAKLAALLTSTGRQLFLEQFLQAPEQTRDTITIGCFYDQATVTDDLEEILQYLQVNWSDITWLDDKVAFQEHELWRQDDNGNRFLVQVTRNKADAALLERKLNVVPHKQLYWIERHDKGKK